MLDKCVATASFLAHAILPSVIKSCVNSTMFFCMYFKLNPFIWKYMKNISNFGSKLI